MVPAIPYMGSKRRLARRLVHFMANACPQGIYFYDLFGGGAAVSIAALQTGYFESVTYNEINPAVVALLRKIISDGVTDEFYEWVSRDDFHRLKDGTDWKAGLVQTCWSFGSDQRSYLYGEEREDRQLELHNAVAAQAAIKGWSIARACVVKEEKLAAQARVDIAHLERLQHLERLEHLESLEIASHSYQDVPIAAPPEQTIIYCDIPYQDTKQYKSDGFDHDAFFAWCKRSPYTVFVSSYQAPMREVYALRHRATLSATANNEVVERLYCNRDVSVGLF